MNRAKIFIVFVFLSAFSVGALAQDIQFPNELKGYEFFGNGRLKDLKLASSTKGDVVKIFGKECIKLCDYDKDWIIKFHYFDNWTYKSSKQNFVSSPEFAGKLWVIEILPKTSISYSAFDFPKSFARTYGFVTGQLDKKVTLKSALKDTNGLTYIFDNEFSDVESLKSANLLAVRYDVPKEIDKKAWIPVQEEEK